MIQDCVVRRGHMRPKRLFIKNGVDIYGCPTCGCIMADVEFEHDNYETASYYTMSFKTKEDIDREWGFRWRHVLRTLLRHATAPRILDVGAGNGFFVHLARTEFGLQADGVEISAAEVAYSRETFGVDLINRDLSEVASDYDAVCSFNVLEHVPDPASLLAQMSAKLKEGGIFIVTTPNPSCIQRQMKGLQAWRMVHPPHHINLFTRTALSELVESAGFDVLEYSTISTYINYVRNLDTESLILRRTVFHLLKSARLGADHLLICRKRLRHSA